MKTIEDIRMFVLSAKALLITFTKTKNKFL